jgi:GT2 family glycosyltransferase
VGVTIAGGVTGYHGDDSYASTIRPLLERPGVRWLGAVAHDRVPGILAEIDVLVVPSIWIENSPFVIREARAAGAVVVASRLGGMAEAVSDGRDGLLFEPGSPEDLRRVLLRLIEEPGLLARLRDNSPAVRSIDDDAAWTARVYEEERREVAERVPAVRPSTAAVVLNYRTPADTLLATRSIEASRRPVSPIVVVDNDGHSDCGEALARGRAAVRVLTTGGNLGFSGGCNAGIRDALAGGAELVLLLNSDATVAPDTVERLEAALAASPRAGIAAPLIVSRSDPGVVSSSGISFSIRSGRMLHVGFGRRAAELSREAPRRVTAASGCALLIRRAVFEQAGLFDERYFYSFEDIDFCLRAARAGWETWMVPSALVYHEGHRSIGTASPARVYFAARNHLLLARTAAPLPWPGSWIRAGSVVVLNAAYALRGPKSRVPARLLSVLRGTLDHLRGRYGPAPHPSR